MKGYKIIIALVDLEFFAVLAIKYLFPPCTKWNTTKINVGNTDSVGPGKCFVGTGFVTCCMERLYAASSHTSYR